MRSNYLILLLLFTFSQLSYALALPKGVYGVDNRHEPNESSNPKIRQYASATAAMVESDILRFMPDLNSYIFPTTSFAEDYEMCSDQRFGEQTHIASCSGFLIADDILITAGHCVENQTDCDTHKWVFDYTNQSTMLNKNDVYGCKEIIDRNYKDTFFSLRDYAIIRLDRTVENRKPLKVRTSGRVKKGTPIVMLGHPSGLPLKYDANAVVAKHWNKFEKKNLITRIGTFFKRASYFTARLDAFAGNSGSPIINLETGEVEGILVSGGKDYTYDYGRDCAIVQKYEDSDDQAQEVVFKITKVKELEDLLP